MDSDQARLFGLDGRVVVITGGAGLLGREHAAAVSNAGGIPVIADIDGQAAEAAAGATGEQALGLACDVTDRASIERVLATVLERYGRVDGLVNNAARDPKVTGEGAESEWSRFETYSIEMWRGDLEVGLTGAFLCSQVIGSEMARRGSGVILNIASDLAVIAPDQRLYRRPGVSDDRQPVKPVSYIVAKTGLIGLTRYLSTYWADRGVRVNALCPGGVRTDQPDEFLQNLNFRIPMGRMARADEYRGPLVFLLSDASSYMTGAVIMADGGRSVW